MSKPSKLNRNRSKLPVCNGLPVVVFGCLASQLLICQELYLKAGQLPKNQFLLLWYRYLYLNLNLAPIAIWRNFWFPPNFPSRRHRHCPNHLQPLSHWLILKWNKSRILFIFYPRISQLRVKIIWIRYANHRVMRRM